jgi:hypothetical protein
VTDNAHSKRDGKSPRERLNELTQELTQKRDRTTAASSTSAGIFISYRRQDSDHLAGRLYDRLADRFGESQVFMDVDTIEPGVDFAEKISRALAACQVLVAVVGPAWLTATDERGRRRLDDQDDFVRLEIETALARGVRIIPVLAQGAVMPGQDDLPESLAGLARSNALLVRHESFRSDAGRLVTAIERVLAPAYGNVVVGLPDAHGGRSAGNVLGELAHTDPGPARNNFARAAQLFTEAERIARSITYESAQAQALGEVAEALAATDPDHAERIARSITNEYQESSALGEVAHTLAATDPDRAERIARSITWEPGQLGALRKVAQALAATDPDHAERIAQSFTYEFAQAQALGEVAEALAATDPDRAERIARSITDQDQKAQALTGIAQALAVTDPDRAERLFTEAEYIARSITHESWKARALIGVAQALAVTDPDRAEQLFTEAERSARSITVESHKVSALIGVAQALAATDPDRAEQLFIRTERIARSITVDLLGTQALREVAEALAATDPATPNTSPAPSPTIAWGHRR